jgi:hypothetical protein
VSVVGIVFIYDAHPRHLLLRRRHHYVT